MDSPAYDIVRHHFLRSVKRYGDTAPDLRGDGDGGDSVYPVHRDRYTDQETHPGAVVDTPTNASANGDSDANSGG